MTTQLTKEQIKRIGAMYWGCEIVTKNGAKHTVNTAFTVLIFDFGGKLLLTPLSAISDEDAIEVGEMHGDPYIKHRPNKSHIIKYIKGEIEEWCEKDFRTYQYLIQKGYAVPLFIEPNHPLNGKDAIELGLAIDKTKEVSHG